MRSSYPQSSSQRAPDCSCPTHFLQSFKANKHSDDGTQHWIWDLDDNQLHYDNHEVVRFQIEQEYWHDQTPNTPGEVEEDQKRSPYTLTASMQMEGLGPCLWWDGSDAVEE